jgi:hypothetical protein
MVRRLATGATHHGKIAAIDRESWSGNLRGGNSENGVQQTLFSMPAPTA